MPCQIINLAGSDLNTVSTQRKKLFDMLDARCRLGLSETGNDGVEAKVRAIIADVQQNGIDAVLNYTKSFDCPNFSLEKLSVSPTDIAKAAGEILPSDLNIIQEAAANIRSFHEGQKQNSWFTSRIDGTILGQINSPVGRAGLYVPGGQGGNTPLISSMLMTAIPAQVAGVKEIAVVTPPRADGSVNPHILAAMHVLGLTEIYAIGSAWAIAALALGAGPIKAVDIIAGPGNIWVSTAKRLLIGKVGIDMIAGPSEIAILADENANPALIAADMLSQAEHDTLASSICITTAPTLPERILAELRTQCKSLPRAEIAEKSLNDWSAIVLAQDMEQATELMNLLAPEHLEVMCENAWELVPRLHNAGAIFVGPHSAEPLGDYFAGPNHVLPTMGTARFASALGVDTFCKKTSIIAASAAFAQNSAKAVARLARLEALEGHARSAEARLGKV